MRIVKLMSTLWVVVILLSCGACLTDNNTIPGPTVEALADAAGKQKDSTETIDKEASSIQKKSKEDHSVASAGKIKEANVNLKNNIDVLSKEAEAKEILEKKLEEANIRIEELEEEDNAMVRYITYGLIGIGTLLMAVGAVLFVKSGFTQWEVAALGLALVTSSMLTNWLAANFIWFILILAGIALVGVILWVFLRTDKVAEVGVQVGEMLKHEIKSLSKVEFSNLDEKEEYVNYADVKNILTKIFGDTMHHGQAGSIQTEGISNHITAKRKKLIKKATSFYN